MINKHLIIFGLVFVLFSSFVSAYSNNIVCAGDSITDGAGYTIFCTQVTSYATSLYGTTYTEFEKGISSGCLTADGATCPTHSPLVNRYENDILANNPRWTILHSIINDVGYDVNLSVYEQNYTYMVNDILNSITGDNQVLITDFPPIDYSESYPQYNGDEYNYRMAQAGAITRQVAIRNEVPYLELNYLENHSSNVYTYDGVHYNQAGHNFVSDRIEEVLANPSNYIMTSDNWNFYYDYNQSITVENFTINAPSNTVVETGTNNDWIVLKNIQGSNFSIYRADNPFYVSFDNKLNPNEDYKMIINNDFYKSVEMNSTGGLTDLYIPQQENKIVTFEPQPLCEPAVIKFTANAINGQVGYNMNCKGDSYINNTNNIINIGQINEVHYS